MLCKDSFVSKCDCQHPVDTLLSSVVAGSGLQALVLGTVLSTSWHQNVPRTTKTGIVKCQK